MNLASIQFFHCFIICWFLEGTNEDETKNSFNKKKNKYLFALTKDSFYLNRT